MHDFLGGFPSTMTSTYGLGLMRARPTEEEWLDEVKRAQSRVRASWENEGGSEAEGAEWEGGVDSPTAPVDDTDDDMLQFG